MEKETRKIILLDICGTIYRSNTTFDFLDYFFADNIGYKLFCFLFRCKFARLVNKIIAGFCKYDFLRYFSIRFLEGYTEQEILQKAGYFCKEILEHKKQNKIIEIINQNINQQNHIIIVSATLDCVAVQVAKVFGINEYYASELEYRNNICTGKIRNDLLDCKLVKIQEKGIAPPFELTISDNFTDIELMKHSKYSYIISRIKRKRKWERILKKNRLDDYEIIYFE
jgi:phosphoserine phosphatase